MRYPYIIFIQGPPAVGKTTLAHKLQSDLGTKFIAKDDIKELFYDIWGTPHDRNESRIYGEASMRALFAAGTTLTSHGESVIIESAFHPTLANKDIATMLDQHHSVACMQLFCHTSPEEAFGRYQKRLHDGTRHPAHPTDEQAIDDFRQYNNQYTALDVEDTVDVDTTYFGDDDYRDLLKRLRQLINERTKS